MDGYNLPSLRAAHPNGIRWNERSATAIEAQLALGPKLSEVAYRLRYDAYFRGGFIPGNTNGMFSDEFDSMGNCRTVIVFKGGVPAATIRITRHDPSGSREDQHDLPAMKMFGSEIRSILQAICPADRPARALEINRLARSPQYSKNIDVVFALFRVAGYLFLNFNADVVFNAVRSHHAPMYRRFGFQQLEEPKQYPGLAMKTGLMASFSPGHAALIDGQPFLRGIATTDEAYAGLIAGERVAIFGARSARAPQSPQLTEVRQAG